MTTWYEAHTGNHQGLVVEETTGRNIAVAYDKADARLIAVAPELLAALETIARLAESGSMSLRTLMRCGEEASAAIAKAKGAQ